LQRFLDGKARWQGGVRDVWIRPSHNVPHESDKETGPNLDDRAIVIIIGVD
jgi:hypothetical protein